MLFRLFQNLIQRGSLAKREAQHSGAAPAASPPRHLAATVDPSAAQIALELGQDGFFVLDAEGKIVDCNAAVCDLLGYPRDELLHTRLADTELPRPQPDGASDAGMHADWRLAESLHLRKDGRHIWLESSMVVVGAGDQTRIIGITRERTLARRQHDLLVRNEAKYRTLVESSYDLVFSADIQGRWTFVNSAVRQIYGYEPTEMTGRTLSEFLAPDQQEHGRVMFEFIRAGKPIYRYETEHLRRDGSRVVLSFNAAPVRDAAGNIVGASGTASDITERRDAERRLRAANARFEALVAGLPLAYVVWSPDGEILEWNPAASATFGHAPEDVIGERLSQVLLPLAREDRFAEIAASLLAGRRVTGTKSVCLHKSGEEVIADWFHTVLRDPFSDQLRIVSIVNDLTERERLSVQLVQAQKLESLGVLAGGVAHDFNNLLVGILGNASLALEKLPADSDVRELVQRIVSAGKNARDLSKRMLAYAGRSEVQKHPLSLNQLVTDLSELARSMLPAKVQLYLHLADELPMLEADSAQLQQVVMNLLVNAGEAIEGDGTISVSSFVREFDRSALDECVGRTKPKPGSYIVVEVMDTGCGMSPDTMARIFEPFFTTKFAGRGLGLSAILGIVEAHGGGVIVQSGLNKGTTFRVLLPARETTLPQPAAAEEPEAARSSATVLVIDDDPEVREVLRDMLRSRGLTVLDADSGPTGIEVFREKSNEIDVVLLDVNMPTMDGPVVLQELRTISPDVPVVVSTGSSEREAASRFGRQRPSSVVLKPFTTNLLVKTIVEASRKS
jgi:PAS domain S-box-containing protein